MLPLQVQIIVVKILIWCINNTHSCHHTETFRLLKCSSHLHRDLILGQVWLEWSFSPLPPVIRRGHKADVSSCSSGIWLLHIPCGCWAGTWALQLWKQPEDARGSCPDQLVPTRLLMSETWLYSGGRPQVLSPTLCFQGKKYSEVRNIWEAQAQAKSRCVDGCASEM